MELPVGIIYGVSELSNGTVAGIACGIHDNRATHLVDLAARKRVDRPCTVVNCHHTKDGRAVAAEYLKSRWEAWASANKVVLKWLPERFVEKPF